MDKVAIARINTFGTTSPKADFVPPSEQLITLTYGQLAELFTEAVEKALQPLQDEIAQLRATVDRQGEKIAALESMQDTHAENSLIQLRLINDLREAVRKEPQPMQKDRGEILRALLAANGGKMLAKDARNRMHLSESRFSELLAIMQEYIDTKPYHLNKSAKILILK